MLVAYLVSSECGGEEAQVFVVCKVTSSLGFVRFVYSVLEAISHRLLF